MFYKASYNICECQMWKASQTLNYMSSCSFYKDYFLGNTEADVEILWKLYL